MKLFNWAVDASQPLPPDRLRVWQLARGGAALHAASGVPASADCCAYEPTQRLLAVSTVDARVKLFGREGVERTLFCAPRGSGADGAPPAATRHLAFLVNRGALLRVDTDGELQLWAVEALDDDDDDGAAAGSGAELPLQRLRLGGGDAITHAVAMERQPFVLLGCRSGAVRVALMADAAGEAVEGARQVHALQLLPHSIPAAKLEAAGEVVHLASRLQPPRHLVLSVHSSGSSSVWDARAQRLVANVGGGDECAPVTAAAWLGGGGGAGGDFATGHADGEIILWALPDGPAAQEGAAPAAKPPRGRGGAAGASAAAPSPSPPPPPADGGRPLPRLLRRLRIARPLAARPVWSVELIDADDGEALLVLGGQEDDLPDGFTLLPLSPHTPAGASASGSPGGGSPPPGGSEGGGGDDSGGGGGDDDGDADGGASGPAPGVRRLHWIGAIFSHAVVPGREPGGPAAVVTLLTGGEVWVHELARGAQPSGSRGGADGSGGGVGSSGGGAAPVAALGPQSLAAPFQAQPRLTAACIVSVPVAPVPVQGHHHSPCMINLRAWAAASLRKTRSGGGGGSLGTGDSGVDWSWVVGGGVPARPEGPVGGANPYSFVYCTGHQDGAVRLWELHGNAPSLLGRAPSREAAAALGSAPPPRAVSAVAFSWEQGLLVTGHEGGEVRLYEFSQRPRTRDVLQIESVGGAANNAASRVAEPPGFQLRLRCLVHGADVTALAACPVARHIAVGDASGAVSLLDIAAPALLWLQAPLRAPIASISLGRCPLPAPRERNELLGALAALPAGAGVRAVVAAGADASVVVLDAATGFCLGREGPLRPKHPSVAVLVEALDASGAPLWAGRDVEELAALARDCYGPGDDDDGGAAAAAPACRSSGSESSSAGGSCRGAAPAAALSSPSDDSDGPEGGGSGGGGASAVAAAAAGVPLRTGSGAGGRPLGEAREGEGDDGAPAPAARRDGASSSGAGDGDGAAGGEEDVEALLAMASMQIDGAGKARRAANPLASWKERRAERQVARVASPRASEGPGGSNIASSSGGGGGGGGGGGEGPRAASPRPTPRSRTPSPRRARVRSESPSPPPLPAPPPPAAGAETAGAESADAAAAAVAAAAASLDDARPVTPGAIALEDPEAVFLVVAAEGYVRLYPAERAARGDRTALRRVPLPGRLRFASVFCAGGSPALVGVVDAGGVDRLQVYSLPGLGLAVDAPLSAACGWRWGWDAACDGREPRLAACARHGLLALIGQHRELVRVALGAGLPAPAPPARVFDWELAAAAAAAEAAADAARGAAAAAAATAAAAAPPPHRRGARQSVGGVLSPRHDAAGAAASAAGTAAAAAAAAASAASAFDAPLPPPPTPVATPTPGDGEPGAADAAAAAGAGASGRAKPDFKGFMAKIGQDFQKAIDETHKGIQKVKEEIRTVRSKDGSGAGGGAYSYPELRAVFESGTGTPAASPRHPAADGPAPQEPPGGGTRAGARGGGSGASGSGSGGGGGGAAAAALDRRELLSGGVGSGSSAGSGANPSGRSLLSGGSGGGSGGARVRSAAEIRAAYGRPLASDAARTAQSLGATLGETRAALGERGEKLQQLQDKTSDLVESAANFAEMAKQLADREKQRAKWFGLG
ncbi:hypothetical protein Rsub_09281 [Raphidocelis subcapitata]|uniref:V-SNARE coiled-coil homology domain-containing protein n=1 Tax=Raphidocelis subcapitata TaxID=307507 RepID=A0A2V0P9W0_9CHLO|nr:hypothetical protein Rsub_09281 [Raphidocelis subcapitata]|eukprot:GBF96648.1 hypothetical protein Rsub_09281 [Raphidocelis subcapitata]